MHIDVTKRDTKEILARLEELHSELLTADGFDDAIIGIAEGWFGQSQQVVVCYDYDRCVAILVARDGMSEEEADEFLQFNTLGAYVGPHTPVFLHKWRD